jgi:hypothetical protein
MPARKAAFTVVALALRSLRAKPLFASFQLGDRIVTASAISAAGRVPDVSDVPRAATGAL